LSEKVKLYGTQNWVVIARYLPGRLGRQCRERWHNVIDPSIVRREWTQEEDLFIIVQFNQIGSRWSQISKMEPLIGRTVSQIKNRYYQNLKGKDISKIKYKISSQTNKDESRYGDSSIKLNLKKRKYQYKSANQKEEMLDDQKENRQPNN
jgi:hypothetical protein